jgi:uncharacterized protein YndB with AHSA1/START domain
MPSTIRLHRVFKAPPQRVYLELKPNELIRYTDKFDESLMQLANLVDPEIPDA